MMKIRNGKYYRRKFTIPEEQSCIRWESEKKRGTESKIMVSQMIDLLIGQHTPAFQVRPSFANALQRPTTTISPALFARSPTRSPTRICMQGLPNVEMGKDWSFSLVYRELGKTDEHGNQIIKTLDVIAETETWCVGAVHLSTSVACKALRIVAVSQTHSHTQTHTNTHTNTHTHMHAHMHIIFFSLPLSLSLSLPLTFSLHQTASSSGQACSV